MSIRAADLPKRATFSAIADAAGVAEIRFTTGGRVAWEVSQVTIECLDAPFGAVAALRVNDVLVTPLVPNGDAAAGDPPLPVRPGDVVSIRWEGLTVGIQGRVLVMYRTAAF